jgi:replication factor C small subunit
MNNNYSEINDKLNSFISKKQIPNIIFHGNYYTDKYNIVMKFINIIYNNNDNLIKKFVMIIDCAQGKGIKFVREDLKYFAKTNVDNNMFKSVILINADNLTIDAQSALRRCIEIFSHSTRFFMVVNNISKLLNPILSRFCNIFLLNTKEELYNQIDEKSKLNFIKKNENIIFNIENIFSSVELLYKKGISGLNLLKYISNLSDKNISEERKKFILFYCNKIKKDIRNEKLFLFIILNWVTGKNKIILDDNHYI